MPLYADDKAKDGLGHLPAKFRASQAPAWGTRRETAICKGSHNPFSIKPKLHLGLEGSDRCNRTAAQRTRRVADSGQVAAYSIAVALRWAVAASLGVKRRDRLLVRSARHPHAGRRLCSRSADHAQPVTAHRWRTTCPNFFRRLAIKLDCHANCQGACQHCLMDYDNRFRRHELDRFLPSRNSSRKSGCSECNCSQATSFLTPAIRGNPYAGRSHHPGVGQGGATELRIFLQGDPRDWDFAFLAIRRFAPALVRALVPSSWSSVICSPSFRPNSSMRSTQLSEVTVPMSGHTSAAPAKCWPRWLRREDALSGVLATKPLDCLATTWGQAGSAVLVQGRIAEPETLGDALETKGQTPTGPSPEAGRIEMRTELDGLAEAFGPKLLDKLAAGIHGPATGR